MSQQVPDPNDRYRPVGDFIGGLSFMAYALYMLIEALRFPRRGMGFVTTAGFTPFLLGCVVFTLAGALVVYTLRTSGYRPVTGWIKEVIADETVRRWANLVLITGAYIGFVGHLNFVLLNMLYLVGIFAYLRAASGWQLVLYGIVGGIIVGWLVPWVFAMPVP